MNDGKVKPILGVLGGMGGLASSEFVKTIYEYNAPEIEQESPTVILYSDPTFPDRTAAFLSKSDDELLGLLVEKLELLLGLNSSKIVLCCVTLHYLLPRIDYGLKKDVLSLVDLILASVVESKQRQLLLCSTGAREARIFQDHEMWDAARDYVVFPDEEDQRIVHRSLYQYKTSNGEQPLEIYLKGMLKKYRAGSFIAGCSELHLLTKHLLKSREQHRFIDPLLSIAKNLPALLRRS
jgi:aspartate racemase